MDRHRDQRRFDAVSGHVDQIDDEVVVIDPGVVETVTTNLLRGQVARRHRHRTRQIGGKYGRHVSCRAVELGPKSFDECTVPFLTLGQPALRFHPFGDVDDLGDEVFGFAAVITDATQRQVTPNPMPVGVDVLTDGPV